MTKGLVTCKKCGKTFNYDTHDGVCPKCCRYYSLTRYNEEEAMLANILASANEENCSYHGGHDRSSGLSGHSEELHRTDINRTVNRTANRTVRTSAMNNQTPAKKKTAGVVVIVYVIIFIIMSIIASFD